MSSTPYSSPPGNDMTARSLDSAKSLEERGRCCPGRPSRLGWNEAKSDRLARSRQADPMVSAGPTCPTDDIIQSRGTRSADRRAAPVVLVVRGHVVQAGMEPARCRAQPCSPTRRGSGPGMALRARRPHNHPAVGQTCREAPVPVETKHRNITGIRADRSAISKAARHAFPLVRGRSAGAACRNRTDDLFIPRARGEQDGSGSITAQSSVRGRSLQRIATA
jgi:hypothetical protein